MKINKTKNCEQIIKKIYLYQLVATFKLFHLIDKQLNNKPNKNNYNF